MIDYLTEEKHSFIEYLGDIEAILSATGIQKDSLEV